MRQTRTSGLMSGEGKRSHWQKPQRHRALPRLYNVMLGFVDLPETLQTHLIGQAIMASRIFIFPALAGVGMFP